jgi:hypothetical protein
MPPFPEGPTISLVGSFIQGTIIRPLGCFMLLNQKAMVIEPDCQGLLQS